MNSKESHYNSKSKKKKNEVGCRFYVPPARSMDRNGKCRYDNTPIADWKTMCIGCPKKEPP